MMPVDTYDASHVTYLLLCHRKLWLHHHGMRMEDNSADVHIGKVIGKSAYDRRARRWRELVVGPVKIDHYDPKARLIHEVKKSPKLEHVHVAQVQYYLWQMERHGVGGSTGVIEYPKQRKTVAVSLDEQAHANIREWLNDIERIVSLEVAPPAILKSYCGKCAFYDFCYC